MPIPRRARALQPYDIVVIKADYEDAEAASQRGLIIGMVEGDEIAVFVYEFERVWCMKASDVSATCMRDDIAANARTRHAGPRKQQGRTTRLISPGELRT